MAWDNNQNFFDMIFSKSNYEIIKEMQKNGPVQFKDLKFITNPITNKKYSTRTIAESLKELEEKGIIENKIITKNNKKALGYTITEKGKQTIKILKEAEEKYHKL